MRWAELPFAVALRGSRGHFSLNPATQSNARPAAFTPPCAQSSSKPTYAQPWRPGAPGTNQILVLGFDQSSLLQNKVRRPSVRTKMLQGRAGGAAAAQSARANARPPPMAPRKRPTQDGVAV